MAPAPSPYQSIPMVAPDQKEEEREYEWGRWLSDPWNEIKAAGKSAKELLIDPVLEYGESAERLNEGYTPLSVKGPDDKVYLAPDGSLVDELPTDVEHGMGALRTVSQPLQYFGEGGEKLRQNFVDFAAERLGATKEEDLIENPDARRVQGAGQFVTETAIASALTAGTFGLGGAGFARLSPSVQAVLSRAFPGKRLAQWLGAGALEGAYSGLTQDPYANQAPFSNIQPEDPAALAALKNIPGNAATDAVLGGALDVGTRVVGKSLTALFPNLSRKTREVRAQQEVQGARNELEQQGLQEKRPDGTYAFTEEAVRPEAEPDKPTGIKEMLDDYEAKAGQAEEPAIPSAEMEPGGAVLLGDLPEADPGIDPWADPSLLEVDALQRGLDRLDDPQLQRVAESDGVVEATDAEIGQEVEFIERPQQLVTAPADRLADTTIPYMDQIAAINNDDLLSMADPRNSQQLFERVSSMTGKELEDFTRKDVMAGIESLANKDNIQFLPNRIDPQSGGLADVNEIKVDPERFQYKSNVNDQGQQKGNSLEGTKKWSTDFEGVVDVWEDPADGQIYVVNGHNRLAKAKEMGVGSIRVNFIPARTAEQARAFGAAANIASGSGTAFDAAKYFRDSGLDNAQGLEAAGIPMAGERSLGAQGLALSKLPPGVFQDAVDGKLPLSTAVKIGSSGLSPENMIRVASITQDMGPMAALEVIDMAKTAPKVLSDQGTILGAEYVNTLEIKAQLAARLRSEMTSAKNTFKGAAKDRNAKRLQQANTNVDQTAATEQAGYAEQLLGTFDAEKYAEGTEIARLLNEGTEDIASGAKPAAVARRLLAELQDQPLAPQPKAKPEPEAPSPEQQWEALSAEEAMLKREQAEKKLLSQRKIDNRKKVISDADDAFANDGEVDLKKVERAQKQLDDHAEADAYIAWYDQRNELPLTPEQRGELKKKIVKKAIQAQEVRPSATESSILDNPAESLEELVLDPINAMREEIRLAGQYAEMDAAAAAAEAQAVRVQEGFYEQDLTQQKDQGLLERFPDESEPEFPEPEGEPSYQLPADVAKSKPRYGLGIVQFGNDLDRAAYIIRSKSKKSKGEDRIIASLEEQGFDIAQVRKHGEKVKKAISDQVLDMTGSRRAPQSSMEIVVPEVPFGAEPLLSPSPELPPTPTSTPGRSVFEQEDIRMMLNDEIEKIVGERPYDKNLLDSGPSESFPLPKAHGGDGKQMTTAAGRYYNATDVIAIYDLATADMWMLNETAWHESWHRLQFQNLTRKEMAVLNGAKARSRLEEMASLPVIMNALGVAGRKPSSIEMQAFAFQKYVSYRKAGIEDPFTRTKADNAWIAQKEALQYADALGMNVRDMEGDPLLDMFLDVMGKDLTTTFKKFFDKLYTLIERLENFAKGNGFQSVKDVYERAYSGGMAKRQKIYDAKLISALVSSKNPKKLAKGQKLADVSERRGEFLELWNIDNDPGKLAKFLEEGSRQIQFERDALIQQAIKEGC